MINTARIYSGGASRGDIYRASRESNAPRDNVVKLANESVQKQKQQRKTKDIMVAMQYDLSSLVCQLEDRDTQHQAFSKLLDKLPRLEGIFVDHLFVQIEKIKNPGRSSTRRMFVLLLAAIAKCHPVIVARLFPRVLTYVSLRLRDKEAQVTDACAILCSAISVYVIPTTRVSKKGTTSPRKLWTEEMSSEKSDNFSLADDHLNAFEHFVAHFSSETNAVGEQATRCIACIVFPVDFDGLKRPSTEVIEAHGALIMPFLRGFFHSVVAKMDASTRYSGYTSSFLLLQAIVQLAKVLKQDSSNRNGYDIILPKLGNLVDAIEGVYRDGPRDDWVARQRGIELLILLIDLFATGETAENGEGTRFFDENLARISRLVAEARHDPVSSVRNAAVPAVVLLDRLVILFPRPDQSTTPLSPFKRVYASRGGSGHRSGFRVDGIGRVQPRSPHDQGRAVPTLISDTAGNVDEHESDFGALEGDESVGPQGDSCIDPTGGSNILIPLLQVPTAAASTTTNPARLTELSKQTKYASSKRAVRRTWIPRVQSQNPSVENESVQQNRASDDEVLFLDQSGDESAPESADVTQVGSTSSTPTLPHDINAATSEDTTIQPLITRPEAAMIAASQGEMDVALRLCFLEDDMTLFQRILVGTREPCMEALTRATRSALCAAFLEMLDPILYETGTGLKDDVWLVFRWLRDLSLEPRLLQEMDPRVLHALELRLSIIAEHPTKVGQVAAHILTMMNL